ncbi:MAG: hypothetical protein GX282_02170 [Campylobacteraceae bacterium]|nr:hypothetical protein [Campylobacteraceae bacterium]
MQSITRKERAEIEKIFTIVCEKKKFSKQRVFYKNIIKKLVSKPLLPSRVQKA